MLLAQAAPSASPALKATVAQEANLIAGALGWIAAAVLVGWVTKRVLGWKPKVDMHLLARMMYKSDAACLTKQLQEGIVLV